MHTTNRPTIYNITLLPYTAQREETLRELVDEGVIVLDTNFSASPDSSCPYYIDGSPGLDEIYRSVLSYYRSGADRMSLMVSISDVSTVKESSITSVVDPVNIPQRSVDE